MSILDIFRSTPPATTPASTAASNPTVPDPTKASDGKNPAFPENQGDKNPLANYKDLFTPNLDKDGKPVAATQPNIGATFSVDPAVINEHASKMDFTKAIPADLLTKAAGGNDPEAFAQVLNISMQTAFREGVNASLQVAKGAFDQHGRNLVGTIPEIVRRTVTNNTVRSDSPWTTDPALSPLVTSLQNVFTTKYPTATPQEIADHVNTYLEAAATTIVENSGKQVITKPEVKASDQEMDWSKYMGLSA